MGCGEGGTRRFWHAMCAGSAWSVNTPTYEDAAAVSRKNLPPVTVWDMLKDAARLGYLFHKWYFGFEPKSVYPGYPVCAETEEGGGAMHQGAQGHRRWPWNSKQRAPYNTMPIGQHANRIWESLFHAT